MDIFSAIIIVVPLITPLGAYFGIDPVHLAIIFIANLELGFFNPHPLEWIYFYLHIDLMKICLLFINPRCHFFVVMLLSVLAITYIPIFINLGRKLIYTIPCLY